MCALLARLPDRAFADRILLPSDLCLRAGVNMSAVAEGVTSPPLEDVVFEVASAAKAHLDGARELHAALPRGLRTLLLPAVPAGAFLDRLQQTNFDVFAPGAVNVNGAAHLALVWRTGWHAYRGTL